MPTVGNADHDGPSKRALLLQLESGLGKGLERHGAQHGVPDPDRLDDDVNRLLGPVRRRYRSRRVMLGQPGQPLDRLLVLDRENRLGVEQLLLRGLTILERDESLAHPEDDVFLVIRDITYGLPGDVRCLPGDDPDLLKRRPRRPTDQEGDVIDIPGGAVGHRGDEALPGAQPGRHEPRELPIIVRRDLTRGRAADVMQGIVGEQSQGLTLGVDHGEDADVGVGGAGRTIQDVR